ncbi:restriction endonuclease subunit S [Streptococcus thermophilus]|uniref:restriction endonuclease subunit S n=1 Tax=Streptococcus thermophilus TaxID=1308 RepID=UPI003A810BAF
MTNSKHIPKRRFKEFESDGEWERDLFRNIADFSIKTNSFSREKLTHESYEVQNIHYGDILIKFQSVLDLKRDNLPSIIDSNVLDFRQSLLQDGDVIFADAAEDSTVGKAIEIRNIMGKNVVSGLHTIAARPIQLFAPYYLGYYLNSDFYHKQILPLMQGTKVSSISKSNLQVTEISFPIIDEQKKIGKFFQKIASLIALHQHKLDKLKNLKKAYLSEMFPAEGERVPKRRFPGFEGEWEEKKLFELADVEGGGTPSTVNPQFWDGDIDWYTPAEIDERVFVDRSKRKITNLGLAKSSAKMLPIGTVLFTSRAGIGKTAILAREGCTNQGFQSIIPKEGLLDSYFIYSLSNKLKSYGERIGAGSTFVEVSGKQMSEMSLIIPSIFEQKQIGNFFNKLDQSISLQQQKLDKLNDLKKAYLNELFV